MKQANTCTRYTVKLSSTRIFFKCEKFSIYSTLDPAWTYMYLRDICTVM